MLQLQISNLIDRQLDRMIVRGDTDFNRCLMNGDLETAIYMLKCHVENALLDNVKDANYTPQHELYNPSLTELMIRECVSWYPFGSYIDSLRESDPKRELLDY